MNWIAEKLRDLRGRTVLAEGIVCLSAEDILRTPLPASPVIATCAPPSARHAALLLRALAEERPIAPLNPRLPQPEAMRQAAELGAAKLWTAEAEIEVEPHAQPPEPPLATLIFTSGSTGRPRCIAHTLEAHLASAQAARQRVALEPGYRWLVQLPLGHISGLAIVFRCLEAGAEAVFGEANFTHVSMVPTQLRRALAHPPPQALRAVLVGGAPTSPSLAREAVARGWPLHLTYGLTEMASQVCTSELLTPDSDFSSVGKPLPGIEIRAPQNRIEVRGPMRAAGEWRQGHLRPLADAHGWLLTHDLAERLPSGSWRILGRADRIIISGGEKIPAELVEAALESLPGITRAAVVPVPHPEFGQRPVALCSGSLPQNWREYLRKTLPNYALPDYIFPLPPHLAAQSKIALEDIRKLLPPELY